MYKLTIVGGPSSGTSYLLKDGENTIGRSEGNDIVLNSGRVSKFHCMLSAEGMKVTLRDRGSANGTFVNGALAKTRPLRAGDRISVGEFVIELTMVGIKTNPSSHVALPADAGLPAFGDLPPPPAGHVHGSAKAPLAPLEPLTLLDRVKAFLDENIVNFVYNLNKVHEWRALMVGMFALLIASGSVLSVFPVLDRVSEKLGKEATDRAYLLARQMVGRNSGFIYQKLETKLDIDFVEREPGVTSAYIIALDGRIMAPGRKLNDSINDPREAAFAASAAQAFSEKENRETATKTWDSIVGVAVPVRVFSENAGKNVIAGLGIVFFDRSLVMLDSGAELLSYIQAMLLMSIVGAVIYFALYRLTTRPLSELNDGIDLALKGGGGAVTTKYKMEEIAPLVNSVNVALQRAQSSGGGGMAANLQPEGLTVDELTDAVRVSASGSANSGVIVFGGERQILHVSPFMEEVTGIHSASATGQDIQSAARDAAFVSLVTEILGKVAGGMGAVANDDFEFSGVSYRMECIGIGSGPAGAKVYVLSAMRAA